MPQHPLEHRFKRLAEGHNKKARRLGRPGRITYIDLYNTYMESEGLCSYCDIGIEPHLCSFDHVVPFDKGGDNTRSNLLACCISCQRSKFTKSPEEYAEWQKLELVCPVDGTRFRPRWADYARGHGKYCSRRCAGTIGGQVTG